jgi:hypothetical protein
MQYSLFEKKNMSKKIEGLNQYSSLHNCIANYVANISLGEQQLKKGLKRHKSMNINHFFYIHIHIS